MHRKSWGTMPAALVSAALATTLVGCALPLSGGGAAEAVVEQVAVEGETSASGSSTATATIDQAPSSAVTTSLEGMAPDGALDTTGLFTDRDLRQEADLADAVFLTVESDQALTITEEGVYVLSGTATNATIMVAANDAAKVQLVLDGLAIENDDCPAIYVASADKVFVTTAEGSESALTVSGTFVADGDTTTDAAIFSKDDLVLNGLGTLTISSTANGVTCKDDLTVTGGAYVVTSGSDGIEAHDSISIAAGDFTIASSKDALHCENDEDDTVGSVYLCGGTFDITAADDGIQGTTITQIDGGTVTLDATEGIEGTYVQVNGGTIDLTASDDGINASQASSAYTPTLEIRGGELTISMASGDTDALDSNGSLSISGGRVDISAQSAFDFEYGSELTGGAVYVNGEQVSVVSESMAMGRGAGMGVPGGAPGW